MAIVTVENKTYKVDPVYQWDVNQVLQITGLSVPSVPEIHYTNSSMNRAIVESSTMSMDGVITANIPNSLLQKPYKILAYVCVYEGTKFRSLYKIEIPVKARNKPSDYTIEDGVGEIYSFRELENKVANALLLVDESIERYNEASESYADAVEKYGAVEGLVADAEAHLTACEEMVSEVNTKLDECNETLANYQAINEEVGARLNLSRATLTAGETSVTIEDERITENSILSIFTSVFNVVPTNVVAEVGKVTLTFYALEYDLEVGVRVNG